MWLCDACYVCWLDAGVSLSVLSVFAAVYTRPNQYTSVSSLALSLFWHSGRSRCSQRRKVLLCVRMNGGGWATVCIPLNSKCVAGSPIASMFILKPRCAHARSLFRTKRTRTQNTEREREKSRNTVCSTHHQHHHEPQTK